MICDDLPTNLDYLDESFGTAAGLRELRDDDLDDFDEEDVEISPTQGVTQTGIISKIGGETIKMLCQEIRTIENYFDNLPPELNSSTNEYITVFVTLRGWLTFTLALEKQLLQYESETAMSSYFYMTVMTGQRPARSSKSK